MDIDSVNLKLQGIVNTVEYPVFESIDEALECFDDEKALKFINLQVKNEEIEKFRKEFFKARRITKKSLNDFLKYASPEQVMQIKAAINDGDKMKISEILLSVPKGES